MQNLLQDLRVAFRGLVRRPGFTLGVVLTLALGTGATSAIFSIVYGVLLRPFPFERVEELVKVSQRRVSQGGEAGSPVSPATFTDWRNQSRSFEAMAVYASSFATITGRQEPREVQAVRVSADLFRVLGVPAALGRVLQSGEDQPSAQPVVVLGYHLWETFFEGRPEVIGSSITLDDTSYRVVGVMPAEFELAEGELWMPLVFTSSDLLTRGRNYLEMVARLKPGVSLEQARADLSLIDEGIARTLPPGSPRTEVVLVPLYEQIVGDIRPTLLVLMAAVVSVLLITCANIANLLLARTADRQGETAVRVALGASRGRLFRQAMVESLLLAVLGGLCGLFLSYWLTQWLVLLRPPQIPRLEGVLVDLPVVVFTLGISLLCGALFGWAPALQISRSRVHEILKQGGGSTGTVQASLRLRRPLAVIEVALALVLLIGAGLLVRSFQRLQAVDPGFKPENVLTASLNLPAGEYAENSRKLAFAAQFLEQVRALPGVQAAGLATTLPMGRVDSRQSFFLEGQVPPSDGPPVAVVDAVSPQFFRAMGIPLLQGRDIEERDRESAALVAVVDETLAKLWFPKGNAVGQNLILPGLTMAPRTIIGVVSAVKRYGLDADSLPQIYVPLFEGPRPWMSVVVRTGSDPADLAPAVRQAVWNLDRNLPVQIETLDQTLARSLAQPRFNTRLIGILGTFALVLAVVGIYSVMAYSMVHRRHEIGIRMALGGQRHAVLRLVMKEALTLTVLGLAAGLLAAFAVTRLMASLLFGIDPADPTTFALLTLLLGAVALAASYLPARQATQVDPIIALRSE